MHGIVYLMHAFLCSVCNAISYTTQDNRGSMQLRQNEVFTNNSANISLRHISNSLPLPRMCYVLVSNGWLASGSNSNICKSAPAGERQVFWDMGHWSIPQPLFEVMSPRKRDLFVCLRLPVHKICIVLIKANTIHDILTHGLKEMSEIVVGPFALAD